RFRHYNENLIYVYSANLSKFAFKNRNMLQYSYIRENREKVIEGLKKKGFGQLELVDEIIELDQQRRSSQSSLDSLSAEANAAAKQIGDLMRQGKRDEADAIKSKTYAHKELIKDLSEKLNGQ